MWTGYGAAALFAVANAIWALEMPEDGTQVAEILAFYDETADRIVIGGSLSLLAIGLFAVFAAAVREALLEAGAGYLATASFAGALLGMAAGMAAETTNLAAALRAQDGELEEELGQALFELSQLFGSVASAVGFGVFAIAAAAGALRTGRVLPRPVAMGVVGVGVLLLTPLGHFNWLAGGTMVLLAATFAFWAGRGRAAVPTAAAGTADNGR